MAESLSSTPDTERAIKRHLLDLADRLNNARFRVAAARLGGRSVRACLQTNYGRALRCVSLIKHRASEYGLKELQDFSKWVQQTFAFCRVLGNWLNERKRQ
jgi:hypothetical protein